MMTVIYLLFILPFIITFMIGFFSYKAEPSQIPGQQTEASTTIIPAELIQQLQKAGYIDSDGKLKIFNFLLDFMTHGTSSWIRGCLKTFLWYLKLVDPPLSPLKMGTLTPFPPFEGEAQGDQEQYLILQTWWQ
jgi:hypothetical protein